MESLVSIGGLFLVFLPMQAVAENCENWNTKEYFKTATVGNVTNCLHAGADPMARMKGGDTPLQRAVQISDNPAIIQSLLAAGADPNAPGAYGLTPLHRAAESNDNPAVIAALLDGGAYPNAQSYKSGTPLHRAAVSNDNPAVIEALVDSGANPHGDNSRRLASWLDPLAFGCPEQR